MKKTLLSALATVIATATFAQTNTFPTSGNVGIGTTSPGFALDVRNQINVFSLDGSFSNLGGASYGDTNWQGSRLYFNRYRGTRTSPTIVQSGDRLGFLDFFGYDGTMLQRGGEIGLSVDGTTALGKVPGRLYFATTDVNGTTSQHMWLTSEGNLGLGASDTKGYKLAINGSVIATSIKVKPVGNWPDFVFKKDYKLPTLAEVKTYIDKNQHLPDMPSEAEVKANDLDLGEMNRLLLKKVEELTLYLIEQNNRIQKLESQMNKPDKK